MENTKIILSIIVPIYGVEQYLHKCVDSLLAQDMPSSEYEIILVDDGSPDACPQICDEYVVAHSNIRVIHRENGGLSAARNIGLSAANGEYICFVDSDDYWQNDVLGGLMEQVEREELDVLRFDYQNVRVRNEREYEVFQPYKQPHEADKRCDIVDGITYLNERMGYCCYAWQFIFRRDLIVYTPSSPHPLILSSPHPLILSSSHPLIPSSPHPLILSSSHPLIPSSPHPLILSSSHPLIPSSVTFTEGIHFEDVDWLPRMMLRAKRVGSTQTVVYNYLWREGSITLTQGDKTKIRKNLDDQVSIIAKYNELRKQHPACTWLRNMQSNMVAGVLMTVAQEFYAERKEYIKKLREGNVFPLAIADQGRTYRRRAHIINILGVKAYCIIMHLRR